MRPEKPVGTVLLLVAAAFLVAAIIFRRRSLWSPFLGLFSGYVAAEALALFTS